MPLTTVLYPLTYMYNEQQSYIIKCLEKAQSYHDHLQAGQLQLISKHCSDRLDMHRLDIIISFKALIWGF